MKRPEQVFHRQVAEFLSVALAGNAWWTTFPAGGGGVVRGKILASLGLKPGVPDIMILDGRRAVFLELKAKYRKASPEQVECHKAIHRAGGVVHVVKSLEEVIVALRCAGVPMRIARGEAA